ncbi:MAG: polysaccharide lyase family 8 super-sandwich domain-containing protein [Flavobacteriaceae bacterium]
MQKFIYHSIKVLFISMIIFRLNAQETSIKIIKSRVYQSIIENHLNGYSNSTMVNFDENINQISSDFDGEKWPFIKYSDVSREGFDNGIHLNNLVKMAVAYKSNTSKHFKDKSLFQKIVNGLYFWCKNDFVGENWWNNQIGTPKSLIELILVIGDQLPDWLILKSQEIINRADINKGGSRPGGDRIKVSSIAAKNQLFLNDETQFELIINIIENEIKFVDWIGNDFGYTFSKSNTGGFIEFLKANGRGLKYDYSFHHRTDGVNNTLSYGLGWADAFVEWAYYVRNTEYAFSTEKINILVNYYLDGVCKTSVYGVKPDFGAKNRSISRIGSTKAFDNEIPKKIVELTDYRSDELKEIIKLRSKTSNVRPISHATFYWNSEHFTFQRPNFYSSVRLYSSRNMNMESPYNSEGLLNHHRGDGANHIYTRGNEYEDISPVLDYQKIPGTTVVQKDQLPHHSEIKKLGLTDFVGAVSDGRYGAVGFDFKSAHDPLVGRKSWFFFDDQYVCLGSGISSKSKNEVNTTINQCWLNGEVNISSKGKSRKLDNGSQVYQDVEWIHHDKVAYFLPLQVDIDLQNDYAEGSWWRINKQIDSPKDHINKEVFKLWINHGISPNNESYEYIVRPNTKLDELEKGEVINPVDILSNTPYLQAVKNSELNLIQAVFYRAGYIEVSDELTIQASAPSIIMVELDQEDEIEQITVSDPNRELSMLVLHLSKKFEVTDENYRSEWIANPGFSQLVVNLPKGEYSGKSVIIR